MGDIDYGIHLIFIFFGVLACLIYLFNLLNRDWS